MLIGLGYLLLLCVECVLVVADVAVDVVRYLVVLILMLELVLCYNHLQLDVDVPVLANKPLLPGSVR